MKLSVIIPVYNVEKYLERCLDSVVNQTHKDLEIILVDDGSTDSSGAIIDNYASKDARIIAIHKSNGGPVSAYCEGYEHTTAELVTFVDSDDWLDLEMYEQMLNAYDKNDVDMVMCSYAREYGDRSVKTDLGITEGLYNNVQEKFFYKINDATISAVKCNKIFKKHYLDKIIKNADRSISFAEDHIIVVPYALATKSFYFIDKVFYHYRYTGDSSVSKNANYKIIEHINKVHKILSDYDIENKYTKLIDENTLDSYCRAISNFNGAANSDSEKKVLFARLAKEETFRRVLKDCNWRCYTTKQRVVKVALKFSPSMFFKVIGLLAKRKNGVKYSN